MTKLFKYINYMIYTIRFIGLFILFYDSIYYLLTTKHPLGGLILARFLFIGTLWCYHFLRYSFGIPHTLPYQINFIWLKQIKLELN